MIVFLIFKLVHPAKLVENQLAQSQNLLVTDERTGVKIFTETDVCGDPDATDGSSPLFY